MGRIAANVVAQSFGDADGDVDAVTDGSAFEIVTGQMKRRKVLQKAFDFGDTLSVADVVLRHGAAAAPSVAVNGWLANAKQAGVSLLDGGAELVATNGCCGIFWARIFRGIGKAGDQHLPFRRAVRKERRVPEGADSVQCFLARDYKAETVEGLRNGRTVLNEGKDAHGQIVDCTQACRNLRSGARENIGRDVSGYGKHEKFASNSFSGGEAELPVGARVG